MTSIIKVDDVQNQPGTNIISKCGTDVTLGASGDTIALACGASQTGFGRTGTVDWDTTPKTGTVTAATGKGYFVNTTAGEITVNLPAGAAGSIVAVADYANTADTNQIIIAPNGADKIQGIANTFNITVEGGSVTLVYVDGTQGWRPTDASTASAITETSVFVAATGGNCTCTVCTDYKVHKFTGPGTLCISAGAGPAAVIDYFVLAGGASGGRGDGGAGGGGGAGGFRESHVVGTSGSYTASPIAAATSLPITPGPYSVVVGAGGATVPASGSPDLGNDGSLSSFSTISSAGGGAGTGNDAANDGGAGGGGGANGTRAGGSGNTPPTTPSQGKDGGNGGPGAASGGSGGGGGGATSAGTVGQGTSNPAGPGGSGGATEISGGSVTYGGGGGGGARAGDGQPLSRTGGTGGPGGGGVGARGGHAPTPVASAGTTNQGAGGGGGGMAYNPLAQIGAAGGSGIVYIRYKFQ